MFLVWLVIWYEWLCKCPAVWSPLPTLHVSREKDWLSTCWNLKQVNSQTGFLTTNTDEQDFTYFNIQMEVNGSRSQSVCSNEIHFYATIFLNLFLLKAKSHFEFWNNVWMTIAHERPPTLSKQTIWMSSNGTITVQIGQLHLQASQWYTTDLYPNIDMKIRDINAHVPLSCLLSDQSLQCHISIARGEHVRNISNETIPHCNNRIKLSRGQSLKAVSLWAEHPSAQLLPPKDSPTAKEKWNVEMKSLTWQGLLALTSPVSALHTLHTDQLD